MSRIQHPGPLSVGSGTGVKVTWRQVHASAMLPNSAKNDSPGRGKGEK